MISFQQHMNDDKAAADQDLSDWANLHWEKLNPKISNGDYHAWSLVQNCNKMRREMKKKSVQKALKIPLSDVVAINLFFDSLVKSDYALLKEIIVCPPALFEALRSRLVQMMPEHIFYDSTTGQTLFGLKLLTGLFKYKNYRKSRNCASFFSDNLKIGKSKCVYCNILDTDIIKKVSSGIPHEYKGYLDLDHFYDKSRNPFFALSFYNLIPCCTVCNRWAKLTKQFSLTTHINPFHESFEDIYEFVYNAGNIRVVNKGAKPGDKTAEDLDIETRTQHKVEELKFQINYYTDYSVDAIVNTQLREMFVKHFKPIIPLKKKDVLSLSRGKLYRDVFMNLDKNNGIFNFT